MNDKTYDLKSALPNKALNDDGRITDLFGNIVTESVTEYDNKPALPNKWINPDGSYSTLSELLAEGIDMDIYIIVDELPSTGNPKKVYLVPDGKGGFAEYHYHNGKWDIIGQIEIDLSNYYTKVETNQAIATAIQQSITQVLGGEY